MERAGKEIRNIAVIGHTGEGKTTLCEAMLFNAKVIDRMGKIDDGNTVMDFEAEEIAKKISISLSTANLEWENVKINLLDVPGFFDFEGEFIEALTVADSALVVMSAGGVISVGAEKAIDYCLSKKIPLMIFVNQLDKENANYLNTVEALKARYVSKIAPIQIPVMEGSKMTGYVSLISDKAYRFSDKGREDIAMPDSVKRDYDKLKGDLIEVAASSDDELMTKFFDGVELTRDEIIDGVSKGLKNGETIPLLAGSALGNKGVVNLMNQLVRLMPSPAGQTVEGLACKDDGNVVCRVFKTVADPFVGKMSYFKVMRGVLKPGVSLLIANKDETVKISNVYTARGKKQETAEILHAGDIGAFSKLTNVSTGDTLCNPSEKIVLPPIVLPEPVISMAITSVKQGEEEKVFQGLNRLSDEDITFRVEKQHETGETLLCGMGETHIEVLTRKLKNKFNVDAKISLPHIPYKETIKKKAEAEGKHKKQSGGHGQYGHVRIRFEPYHEGDFLFAEEVVGGAVPRQYFPAVEKGLHECLTKGVLAAYPVVNLKATLYDGSYHDVDSSEMAFKLAAYLAFKSGCEAAGPVLLEPIMSVKITVPEAYLGDIMGDINKRRGRILGMDLVNGRQIISAEIPQAEVFKYATDLRAMTQGRGSFKAELARYEEVPAANVAAIVNARKAELEALKNS